MNRPPKQYPGDIRTVEELDAVPDGRRVTTATGHTYQIRGPAALPIVDGRIESDRAVWRRSLWLPCSTHKTTPKRTRTS